MRVPNFETNENLIKRMIYLGGGAFERYSKFMQIYVHFLEKISSLCKIRK